MPVILRGQLAKRSGVVASPVASTSRTGSSRSATAIAGRPGVRLYTVPSEAQISGRSAGCAGQPGAGLSAGAGSIVARRKCVTFGA